MLLNRSAPATVIRAAKKSAKYGADGFDRKRAQRLASSGLSQKRTSTAETSTEAIPYHGAICNVALSIFITKSSNIPLPKLRWT